MSNAGIGSRAHRRGPEVLVRLNPLSRRIGRRKHFRNGAGVRYPPVAMPFAVNGGDEETTVSNGK